jgi:hypothetical protein
MASVRLNIIASQAQADWLYAQSMVIGVSVHEVICHVMDAAR